MHGDDAAALGDALRDGHGEDLFALTEVRARETAPSALATSRRAAKALLLDQSIVAGIGNYLADEALWEQAIAPTRPARAVRRAATTTGLKAANPGLKAGACAAGRGLRG